MVAAGARIAWATVELGRLGVVRLPGLPAAAVGGGRVTLDAGEVGAGYLFGLGLILALVPLGWLVARPRGRVVLAAAGVALALGALAAVAVVHGDLAERAARAADESILAGARAARVRSGPGPLVTGLGAVLGAVGAASGGAAGRRVPPLRMPERPDGRD